MSHRPARRVSASPLFTPHETDRASRKAARRQIAEATAKARAEASDHQAESTPAAHETPAPLYPPSG
ncbi:ATP-binding protein, partial [Streptomyces sp. AK02-01A]|nr:ATP-binding protein [Streptomyces sp. AK02-01A]